MTMHSNYRRKIVVISVISGLMAGCGGSDSGGGVAQHNSSIVISPSGIEHTYRGDQAGYFLDPLTVTVVNEGGAPMRGAEVRLYAWSGVITTDPAGVNIQPYPYVTRTDDFGNVSFYVRTPLIYNVGTTITDFEAFSGSAYNTIDITMTCTDINTTTTTTCD